MKLFIIHAGYYDDEIGIYELHTNFLITARSINEVKSKVMDKEIFKKKNMHIDAVQEIDTVEGYKLHLTGSGTNDTKLNSYDYTKIKQLC